MFKIFGNSNKVTPQKWQGYVKNDYFVLDGYVANEECRETNNTTYLLIGG